MCGLFEIASVCNTLSLWDLQESSALPSSLFVAQDETMILRTMTFALHADALILPDSS